MAQFKKIEIHFVDEVAGERRVVIRPGDGIQAILLPGFKSRIRLQPGEPEIITRPPGKSILEGRVHPSRNVKQSARGPGRVCYMEDGVVKCWNPT